MAKFILNYLGQATTTNETTLVGDYNFIGFNGEKLLGLDGREIAANYMYINRGSYKVNNILETIKLNRRLRMSTNRRGIYGVSGLNVMFLAKRFNILKLNVIDLTAGYNIDIVRTCVAFNYGSRVIGITRIDEIGDDASGRGEDYNFESYQQRCREVRSVTNRVEFIGVNTSEFDISDMNNKLINSLLESNEAIVFMECRHYGRKYSDQKIVESNEYSIEQAQLMLNVARKLHGNSNLIAITDCNITPAMCKIIDKVAGHFRNMCVFQSAFLPSGRLVYIFKNKIDYDENNSFSHIVSCMIGNKNYTINESLFSKANLAVVESALITYGSKVKSGPIFFDENGKSIKPKLEDYKPKGTNGYKLAVEVLKIKEYEDLYNELEEYSSLRQAPFRYYEGKEYYGVTMTKHNVLGKHIQANANDLDQVSSPNMYLYGYLGIELDTEEDIFNAFDVPPTTSRGLYQGMAVRFDTDPIVDSVSQDRMLCCLDVAKELGELYKKKNGGNFLKHMDVDELIYESKLNMKSSIGKFTKQWGSSMAELLDNPAFISELKKYERYIKTVGTGDRKFEVNTHYNFMGKQHEALPNKLNKQYRGQLTCRAIQFHDALIKICNKMCAVAAYDIFNKVNR